MSYRLINSNEIAIKYPEVNEMDCIYVDLPNGLDNEYHYIDAKPKHGQWIYEQLPLPLSDGSKECVRCSVCGTHWDDESNYCPYCGAQMIDEVEEWLNT